MMMVIVCVCLRACAYVPLCVGVGVCARMHYSAAGYVICGTKKSYGLYENLFVLKVVIFRRWSY